MGDESTVPVEDQLTIHQRIGAIVAEMPAIGKGQYNEQQKFMYRGHDDVMNALNPLLSHYRVFFAPRVLERIVDRRVTGKGGVMYEVNLLVEYTFWGPLGDSLIASAWGEGTDMGDKSTNKAMTMALKNVLAQVFAVSTEEQSKYDTDRGADPETVVSWRNAGFDPATMMDAEAPKGWEAIQTLALDLDMALMEWVAEAILALYGKRAADLTGDLRTEAGRRAANALARVRDELFVDGDFPPPSDEQYAAVFAWAFGGVDATPPGPFDGDGSAEDVPSGTAPAATDAPETADDAPDDPQALPGTENAGYERPDE